MPSAEPTVRLLDVDPSLGARLRDDDRAEALDRVVLRTALVRAGGTPPSAEPGRAPIFGFVVVSGLLLEETQIADHPSVRLLGPGDVALPRSASSESLELHLRWSAATDTRVAILDEALQQPLAMWPGLALGLIDRAADQLQRGGVLKAIAQLPRVEDRLEAMFWEVADRWGRVTPGGVVVPLRLTHDLLARLVGGRRPTVSLALRVLAERGTLTRQPDGSWLLAAAAPAVGRRVPEPAPRATWIETDGDATARAPVPLWPAGARDELAASVRRARDDHERAALRLRRDRARYEETRRHSRSLRLRTARERQARQEVVFALMRRASEAPSGG
jgi:CRP/FNR family transcriptional regulator, cyclic AMP receptor protein